MYKRKSIISLSYPGVESHWFTAHLNPWIDQECAPNGVPMKSFHFLVYTAVN